MIMGIFSRKANDRLKYRNKDRVERAEFRGNGVSELVMPDTVQIIGESAFRECRNLRTATLSNAICEIGAYAFRDCDALENIHMPSEMRYPDGTAGQLGMGCFEFCSLMRDITIPEGVAVIPANAFHNCAALESITLPKTIRAVRAGAFAGCARLQTINMPVFPELIAPDAFNDTPHQEEILSRRKPILTIVHITSYNLPEIYQFSVSPHMIGTEQTDDDMSIILDAVSAEKINFRITNYKQAGGTHTVPANTPTRLFYEEYDCHGGAGLQKEEILASYK